MMDNKKLTSKKSTSKLNCNEFSVILHSFLSFISSKLTNGHTLKKYYFSNVPRYGYERNGNTVKPRLSEFPFQPSYQIFLGYFFLCPTVFIFIATEKSSEP